MPPNEALNISSRIRARDGRETEDEVAVSDESIAAARVTADRP
jgi:hypothetical protein